MSVENNQIFVNIFNLLKKRALDANIKFINSISLYKRKIYCIFVGLIQRVCTQICSGYLLDFFNFSTSALS